MKPGMMRPFPFLIAALICSFLISCATVPITGRQTLNLVPASELIMMADQQYAEILKKSKLSTDPAKVGLVKKVGSRIAAASENFMRQTGREAQVSNYKWEFNLIEDDETVNAWCMPGGKVAVYTGILPITQDEAGLAVVVGHEVAHALARHGDERMSQQMLMQLGGMGLTLALAKQPALTQQIFSAAYGVGANLGFILPYSRIQETEADRIGISLMAMSGYDPNAAIPLWERMNRAGGARTPEFLSTHPNPESRIENIQKLIPEALRYYKPAS